MKTKGLWMALMALIMCSLTVNAEEAEINGLWYEVVTRAKEAKVIQYKNNVRYSGDIVIPSTVEYGGVEYSVTSIGVKAFSNCSRLTSVTIPNSVTTIGDHAFWGCSGLTSVTIPNSVTSIGDNAFGDCSGLTSVTIPNSVTSIAACVFFGCTSLTSVTIPNSVMFIGNGAFAGCTGLTSITIPNSVTYIVPEAFIRCGGLTSVVIGSGVEQIGFNAFAQCFNLADVYCYAENVPNTYEDAFVDSYINHSTLHVPASSIESYRTTAPWSEFGKIVTLDGDEPVVEQCATPTIHYQNGKLTFKCATEGVEFVSDITDADIKKNFAAEVDLTATYHISVYATKSGFDNSETATATLCWIDVEPQKEGITGDEDAVTEVKAMPVLIQSEGSGLTIEGAEAGTPIRVYDLSGKLIGNTTAAEGATKVNVAAAAEKVVVVKVGERSVKVVR